MTDTAAAASALFDPPVATPPASDGAATTPPTPPAASTPPATPAEPWLKVNDRTSYNTKEDAIKGWTELQSTLTSLKPFETLMKPVEQGGFGLSAERAIELLDAYADHLASQPSSPATPATNRSDAATVDAAAKGDKVAYDSLTPEWKAHVDYLKKLGYVTADALKPLEDRVNALDARNQETYAAEVNNAVSHGTSLLEATMKEAGITPDEKMLENVGRIVGSAIDRDSYDRNGNIIPGSLADRFLKGNEASRKQIIQEQFDIFKSFGDVYHKSQNASLVAQKTAAQSTQPRNLPPNSSAPPADRKGRLDPAERARRVTEMLEAGRA